MRASLAEKEGAKQLVEDLSKKADSLFYIDPEQSNQLTLEALKYSREIGYLASEARNLTLLGRRRLLRGESDSAFVFLDRARTLAWESGEARTQLYVLNYVVSYHFQEGDWEQAQQNCRLGIELCIEEEEWSLLANFYNKMGATYHYMGNPYNGMEWYKKALAVYKMEKNVVGIASAYGNLGIVYATQGDFEHVLEYMLACKSVVEKHQDSAMLVTVYGNVGNAYEELGQDSLAMVNYQLSLELAERMGNPVKVAFALRAISQLHLSQENWERALGPAERSLKIYQELNNLDGIISSSAELARIRLGEGKPKEAIRLGERAFDWAEENNHQRLIKRSASTLYQAYEQTGEMGLALKYHKAFQAANDSLVNAESIRKATADAVRAEYEVERSLEAARQRREEVVREAQMGRERLWKYIFIGAAVLLAAYVLVVVGYYQRIKNTNRIISKQKDRISYLNSHLEDLVKQRTQELEVKTAQLSEYVFTNSHRVRGPIARILGLVGVWRASGFSTKEEYEQMFEFIDRSAKEADEVIFEISHALEEGA